MICTYLVQELGYLMIRILSYSWVICRVGHRILLCSECMVLLHSERIVLLLSFKERNLLLRTFFEFLATYETQKIDAFFCILFLRT